MVNYTGNGLNIAIPHKKEVEAMTPDEMVAELSELLDSVLKTENCRMSDLGIALEEINADTDPERKHEISEGNKVDLKGIQTKVQVLRKRHPYNGSLESLERSLEQILGVPQPIQMKPIHERIVALLAGLFS